jgi:site-specific DNA recombinase
MLHQESKELRKVLGMIVVYERVSSSQQDITRQAVQRERAAADYPGRDITVIQDDGVSAFKVSVFDRPGGSRLCDLIAAGEVEALYVDAQDRLSRGDDVEWVTFRALCESSGTRVIIDGKELRHDLGGRMEGYLKAMLARQESVEKSHRVRAGMLTAARKGRRSGGPRPFGFVQQDGTLIPVPNEAAVAERIFREYVAGKPQNEIARDLNRDAYTTARGTRWHQAQISQQLRDPKWVGHTRRKIDGEWVLFENTHKAVIPAELFEQAQQMLTSSGRRGRQTRRFLLGNGLLRCGRCGSAMRVMPKDKSWRKQDYYGCLGHYDGRAECDQPTVPRDRIDQAVLHYFQSVGLDVDAMVQEHAESRERQLGDVRARISNAQKAATRAEAQLAHLDALLRKGGEEGLTPAEWRRLAAPAQTQFEAASAALEDLRTEEQAILSEADLADAEQDTLEALASLRAVVAGQIAGAGEIETAQAALRRIFRHFVLHDLRDLDKGSRTVRVPKRALTDAEGWIVEPVPHPQMIVTEHITVGDFPFPVERLRKVPLQTTKGGSKASAR